MPRSAVTPKIRSALVLVLAGACVIAAGSPLVGAAAVGDQDGAAWTPAKTAAVEWVDGNESMLRELNQKLWHFAEPGMLEYRSAAALVGTLEGAGFEVTLGVAGMPTAFVARYGSGHPVIGILAEYDALGGLSQEAVAVQRPRIAGGAGQGCGHSIFGAGSVGAAIAVAHAIESGLAEGTVILYGTPNEEGVVGKAYMARAGLFDELDAALHWHPGDENGVGTGESGNDLTSFMVAFYGRTAHSAGAPWQGRSALDAIELMGVMANYYREHLHPSARIHYVVMEGGKAPNVVPDYAKAWYYLRGGTREMVDEMYARLTKMVDAAAMATATEAKTRLFTAINHVLNSNLGAEVMHANLELIGGPTFTAEEHEFAKQLQEAIDLDPVGLSTGIEPLEAPVSRNLDEYIGSGSTDVAEVSRITPTVGLRVASFIKGSPGHHWVNVACAGMSIGEKGMMVAAKVMAATAVDLMANPDKIAEMRAELDELTGGKPYVSSIPADVEPPALPNPYENPGWIPGDLDYPTWKSAVFDDSTGGRH